MTNESLKAKVEAALFLTEKPLRADALARIVNADTDVVRQTILELIHDYEAREGGLEIADDGGYIVQVKDQYTTLIDEFVPIDMPTALIRTLSAIAIKQPVMQSEVIKLRGAGAYDHIKELIIRELINKREDGGRSPVLTTTKKFQEYFKLSKDGKSLKSFLSDAVKPAGDEVGGQGDETDLAVDTTGDVVAVESQAVATTDVVAAAVEVAVEINDEAELVVTAETQVETFDASPEPGTPSIGTPGSESDQPTGEAAAQERQDTADVTVDKIAVEIVEAIVAESTPVELAD